jgi:hypothetical protein
MDLFGWMMRRAIFLFGWMDEAGYFSVELDG